jgi:DNA-binding beta-propeller fold protein YncE
MKRAIVCFASAALLASCSTALETSPSTATPAQGIPRPPAASGQQRLYVAECCGVLNTGDVARYGLGDERVSQRYINGAHFPLQIAIDDSGTLYVLNESNLGPQGIAITEYDRGSPKRSRRIGYFYWPTAFALDREAKVYVANCNTCIYSSARPQAKPLDSVAVYQTKGTQLVKTITNGIYTPRALAFDRRRNLYVANAGARHHPPSVTVYAPGSTTPMLTISKDITRPGTLALRSRRQSVRNERGAAGPRVRTRLRSDFAEDRRRYS